MRYREFALREFVDKNEFGDDDLEDGSRTNVQKTSKSKSDSPPKPATKSPNNTDKRQVVMPKNGADSDKKSDAATRAIFVKFGGNMQAGLYSLSDFEYHYRNIDHKTNRDNYTNLRTDSQSAFKNRVLHNLILQIGKNRDVDFTKFLNAYNEKIVKTGEIHALIYNSINETILVYYVDPTKDVSEAEIVLIDTFSKYSDTVGDNNDEWVKHVNRTQYGVLQKLITLGGQYADLVRSSFNNANREKLKPEIGRFCSAIVETLGIGQYYAPPSALDASEMIKYITPKDH